jgi:hypothetical protein
MKTTSAGIISAYVAEIKQTIHRKAMLLCKVPHTEVQGLSPIETN